MKNSMHTELHDLQKEKGNICVSIIVPTHRLSPERQENPLKLKKAVAAAKTLLDKDYTPEQTASIKNSIDELAAGIDFLHQKDGIGIYVSTGIRKLIEFPFPVKEKVIVGQNFETRDLIYRYNYSMTYFVLTLSEKSVRLFTGNLMDLIEVRDTFFPQKYTDEYEYQKPSRGTSFGNALKNYEKDKSIMNETRLSAFFKHVYKAMNVHRSEDEPLILMGTTRQISLFEKVLPDKNKVIARIQGNQDYAGIPEIIEKVWPVVESYISSTKENMIREFEEKIGQGYGVDGIKGVWEAASEGKGLRLLVEKDFSRAGFLADGGGKLYLNAPEGVKHKFIPDIVDDVADMVLEKRGEVIYVENGTLKDHDGIALITRY